MKTVYKFLVAFVFLVIVDIVLGFIVPSAKTGEKVLISLWLLFWTMGFIGIWGMLFWKDNHN
jgi:hypothetical protein